MTVRAPSTSLKTTKGCGDGSTVVRASRGEKPVSNEDYNKLAAKLVAHERILGLLLAPVVQGLFPIRPGHAGGNLMRA